MVLVLDIAATLSAFAASVLWFMASRAHLRRVTQNEVIDHHDFNRMIVSFNRVQTLNARAAFATGVSALLVAGRFLVQALVS